jgi:hypothetical protein
MSELAMRHFSVANELRSGFGTDVVAPDVSLCLSLRVTPLVADGDRGDIQQGECTCKVSS